MSNKIISLTKAFRINENTVGVLYTHNERHQDFLVSWNNIDHETGKVIDYDLQIDCLSNSEHFNEIVKNAIRTGERDDNPSLNLYLELRDTFDAHDCEEVNG